jgi:predicted lipoprotein with Yx(FWY)xxD motif
MNARNLLALGASAAALIVAGCGGGGGGSSSTAKPTTTGTGGAAATTQSGGDTLQLASNPKLGKILVDPKGRTLYDFPIDKGTMSVCYGACASLWPPLTTQAKPTAGPGVKAGLIGTAKRTDGTTGVTYGGHPLYYYAPDQKAGQITGQALNQFGAPWYALAPSGKEIHTPAN